MHGRLVTWAGGKIPNGDEGKFSFTARMPSKPGVLVFPSLVTYADGNVVHWIGAESSDTPAPRVDPDRIAAGDSSPPPPPAATTDNPAPNDDSSGSDTWIWIVVVVAILAGLAAILLVRRRRA